MRMVAGLVAVAMCLAVGASTALAEVTVTPAVDVGEHITAGVTALGAVALIAVGGFFAFLIVRKGFTWARRAL